MVGDASGGDVSCADASMGDAFVYDTSVDDASIFSPPQPSAPPTTESFLCLCWHPIYPKYQSKLGAAQSNHMYHYYNNYLSFQSEIFKTIL